MELKDFELYQYRGSDNCSSCRYVYINKGKLVCSRAVTESSIVKNTCVCDLFEEIEF
jgi:hypothetical protein